MVSEAIGVALPRVQSMLAGQSMLAPGGCRASRRGLDVACAEAGRCHGEVVGDAALADRLSISSLPVQHTATTFRSGDGSMVTTSAPKRSWSLMRSLMVFCWASRLVQERRDAHRIHHLLAIGAAAQAALQPFGASALDRGCRGDNGFRSFTQGITVALSASGFPMALPGECWRLSWHCPGRFWPLDRSMSRPSCGLAGARGAPAVGYLFWLCRHDFDL